MNSTQPPTLRDAATAIVRQALDRAEDFVHVCDRNNNGIKLLACSEEIQRLHSALAAADATDHGQDSAVRVCPERDIECGNRELSWCSTCPKRAARPAPIGAVAPERTKLHQMQNEEGEIGWYFDCDGHYIDVERDKDGNFSIFFRDRSDNKEGWLDQADSLAAIVAAAPAAPIAEVTAPKLSECRHCGFFVALNQAPAAPVAPSPLLDTIERERALFEKRFAGATFQRNSAGHPYDYWDATVESLWVGYQAGQQSGAVDGLTFDRRWSLARDGFGLERNDESGEYVAHTDAVAVLHAAITASAVAVDGAPSTNSAAEIPDFGPLYSTRLNAARYRWLLDNYAIGDGFNDIDNALNYGEPEKLSAAIDAAIATMQQSTTPKEST